MGYKHKCKHHEPDIVLSLETGILEPNPSEEVPVPLYLEQKVCKYELGLVNQIITLKKCRELRVKGSSKATSVIITIQTGTETPRVFTFENDVNFELVENLKKGDVVFFERGEVGREGEITLDVSIVKRSHH